MPTISRDTPGLYLTSVAKDRLSVFRSDKIKVVTCAALDEARKSGGFDLYAYVIMPDHVHLITDSIRRPSAVLRFVNGIISRRVIDFLKEQGYQSSLDKLRQEGKARGYRYSLWDQHNNALHLTSEGVFMQKVHYIHQTPVRAGLVERAESYRWSSVRCWNRHPLEDEPLLVDVGRIVWRKAEA
ncbi:MAG: transposase [Pyrinomonadaceae bacterium]